jgi:hypothetical protein
VKVEIREKFGLVNLMQKYRKIDVGLKLLFQVNKFWMYEPE